MLLGRKTEQEGGNSGPLIKEKFEVDWLIPANGLVEVVHHVSGPYRVFHVFNCWYWRVRFMECKCGCVKFHFPVKFLYLGNDKIID